MQEKQELRNLKACLSKKVKNRATLIFQAAPYQWNGRCAGKGRYTCNSDKRAVHLGANAYVVDALAGGLQHKK
jgi:hypothetical protein